VSVTFVGWYGRQNCGDEAFKEVHRQIFPGECLEWVCDRPPSLDPGTKFVLGAGDVFLDFYLQSIPDGADFWVYGVGVGGAPQFDLILKYKDRIKGIWLRNAKDVAVLNGLGMPALYTPDIVFNLRDQTREWERRRSGKTKKMYVILSNNLYQDAHRTSSIRIAAYLEYFKHELALTLDRLAKFYDIVLLPFSMDPNDYDPGFCADIFSLMTKFNRAGGDGPAVRMIKEAPAPIDALRLLHDSDLVLSMKFHGLVFATLLGVPFVNIGISRKNQMFCSDNGLDHLSIEQFAFSRSRLEARVKAAEDPKTGVLLDELGATLSRQAGQAAEKFRRSVLG